MELRRYRSTRAPQFWLPALLMLLVAARGIASVPDSTRLQPWAEPPSSQVESAPRRPTAPGVAETTINLRPWTRPRTWDVQLAPTNEPGPRFEMSGRVLDADGTPAAGVHLYVYHADGQGEYALPAQVFNRIAGVLRTNDRGEYRFRSILPGVYAGTGGHVHFEVWKGDRPVLAHSVSLYGAPGVAFPSRWTRRAIEEWSSRIAVVTRDSSGIYHCHHDLKLTDMSESGESYESLMQAWRNRYGDGHP